MKLTLRKADILIIAVIIGIGVFIATCPTRSRHGDSDINYKKVIDQLDKRFDSLNEINNKNKRTIDSLRIIKARANTQVTKDISVYEYERIIVLGGDANHDVALLAKYFEENALSPIAPH